MDSSTPETIQIRRVTGREAPPRYVADLLTPGWPAFPLVAYLSSAAEVEAGVAAYVARHPGTAVRWTA
jgi:hypothetical protein